MTDTDRLPKILTSEQVADIIEEYEEIGRFSPALDALTTSHEVLRRHLEQAEKELVAAKPYQEFVEWAQHDALHGNCGLESCPLRSHCMKQQRPIICWAVADAWHAWQERKEK